MKFAASLAAAVAVVALLASPAQSQAQTPAPTLKIGFVATFSGASGTLGRDLYDGFMLGLEHSGGKFGGLPVEIIKEDDQFKPDVAVQVADKLIQRDRVNMVVGVVFSNIMMAMYKPVIDAQTFFISANAGPSQIAGAQCSPYFFSTAWQNDGPHEAMGKNLQDSGVKRVFLAAPNYPAGKDALTGFKRFFKGEVVNELYTAVNQPDYAAEITQIRAAKPEALYAFYPGGMGINFVKQYAQLGLLKSIPFYSAFTVDATTVQAQGDAALGTFGTAFWTIDLKNPVNARFVPDYEKKFGYIPSTYSAQAYDAALLIDSGVRGAGGKIDDKDALRDAMRKADFKSVRGDFKFNNNQYPIQSFYLYETVKDDKGRLVQVSRKTVFTEHKDAYGAECGMKW